jgi:hypothetical protein
MTMIETMGSLALVVACLALNVRAYRADAAHLTFETKMMMGVSWIIIIAVLAFVLDRMQA